MSNHAFDSNILITVFFAKGFDITPSTLSTARNAVCDPSTAFVSLLPTSHSKGDEESGARAIAIFDSVPNAKAALSKQSYSPPVESMRPIMVNDVTSITRRGKRAGKDVDLDWSDYFLLIDEVGKFLGGYINISEIAEEAAQYEAAMAKEKELDVSLAHAKQDEEYKKAFLRRSEVQQETVKREGQFLFPEAVFIIDRLWPEVKYAL